MKARLYVDADITPQLGRLLRTRGFDVVSCHESGSEFLTDEQQLERARSLGRAILSSNYRDFLLLARMWAKDGREHAGIVVSYNQCVTNEIHVFAQRVAWLLDSITAESLTNTTISLDDFQPRNLATP